MGRLDLKIDQIPIILKAYYRRFWKATSSLLLLVNIGIADVILVDVKSN